MLGDADGFIGGGLEGAGGALSPLITRDEGGALGMTPEPRSTACAHQAPSDRVQVRGDRSGVRLGRPGTIRGYLRRPPGGYDPSRPLTVALAAAKPQPSAVGAHS
ncbi:hypothetical protein GCM10027570_37360 [Streptomonospora sediminis]